MDDPGDCLAPSPSLQVKELFLNSDDWPFSLQAGGGSQNASTNYNLLLKQIETLSEVQNSGAIQNADPSLQAAYVARLQQQASQIKNLLKLLNSSGVNKSSNDANDSNGYESLWEVGLARNIRDDLIPEVEEGGATIEADESQDVNHEDIYENTGVFPHNFSLSVGEFLWVSRRELFRGCRVIPSCTMLCDTMQIFWKTVVGCEL